MPIESKFMLRVASPCRAAWDAMDGNDQVRFCRECSRNVYNLSEMSRDEAQRVINQREGRICVRFYQRRDGTVLTSDCPVGQRRTFLRTSAGTAFAVAGLTLGLTSSPACGPATDNGVDVEDAVPPVVMGKMLPELDAGVPGRHKAADPEPWIMGDVAIPEERAIMGSIALPPKAE